MEILSIFSGGNSADRIVTFSGLMLLKILNSLKGSPDAKVSTRPAVHRTAAIMTIAFDFQPRAADGAGAGAGTGADAGVAPAAGTASELAPGAVSDVLLDTASCSAPDIVSDATAGAVSGAAAGVTSEAAGCFGSFAVFQG